MALMINRRQSGEIEILDLAGKLVLGEESGALREIVKGLLAENRKNILLNLSDVTFIDSTGVGTLVGVLTSARQQGGQLKLIHLTKKFQETLQVTRLLTVFETHEDEAAALASFS